MKKSLLPMLISAAVAVDGIWGLDSITHLQRRNVRLKQPHWKSTQSDVAKSDAIAKQKLNVQERNLLSYVLK